MSERAFKTLIVAITSLLLVLSGAFLTGCNSAQTQALKPSDAPNTPGSTAPTSPPAVNPTPSAQTPHSVKLTLYFPNSDATGLIPTDRVTIMTDQEVIKTMFKELETPPSGLEKPLPQGTNLISAAVENGVAIINLSKEFRKNFRGGSASEQMTIYSIVNTLTTLSNVHSVQFLLEGKKQDGILGNLATDMPLKRNESLILKTN